LTGPFNGDRRHQGSHVSWKKITGSDTIGTVYVENVCESGFTRGTGSVSKVWGINYDLLFFNFVHEVSK